jgi:hypothetical protein
VTIEQGGVFKPNIFGKITEIAFGTEASALQCYCALNQHDYRGTLSTTVAGKTCIPWDQSGTYTEAEFPNKGLEGGHNYCRNPDGDSRVWCIFETETVRYFVSRPPCDPLETP